MSYPPQMTVKTSSFHSQTNAENQDTTITMSMTDLKHGHHKEASTILPLQIILQWKKKTFLSFKGT